MANIEKQENLQVKAESNKQQIDAVIKNQENLQTKVENNKQQIDAVIKNQENLQTKVENNKQQIDAIVDKIYPIGSIYMSMNATSPSTLFGGTWQSIGAGRVLQGADDAHAAGTEIEAGLPNIKGSVTSDDVNYYWGAGTSASGAFKNAHVGGSHISGASWGGSRGNGFDFDAARCSAIYGKSDTVQPPALAVYIWQRTA